jgi:hypothetical protein
MSDVGDFAGEFLLAKTSLDRVEFGFLLRR